MSHNNQQPQDRLKLLGRLPVQATQELALPPRIRTAECHKPIATVKAVVQRHGWGEGRLTQEQLEQLAKQRDLEEQLQQEKLAKLQAYHAAVVKRAAVVQKDMQIRKMQLHKELDQASRRRDTHKTYAERLLKAVKQRAASKAAANNQQDQASDQARLQDQQQPQAAGSLPAIARNQAAVAAGSLFMQSLQNAAAEEVSSSHQSSDNSSMSSSGAGNVAAGEAGSAQEAVGTADTNTAHVTPAAGVIEGAGSSALPAAAAAAAAGGGGGEGMGSSLGVGPPGAQQEALQAQLGALQLTQQTSSPGVGAELSHPMDADAAAEGTSTEGSAPAAAGAVRLDPAAATQRLAAWSTSTGATSSSRAADAAAGPAGEAVGVLPEAAPYAAGRLVAAGHQAEQGAAAVVNILAAEADYKDCSRAGAGRLSAAASDATPQAALTHQRSSHAVVAPLLPEWLDKATLAAVTAEVQRRGIHLPRLCPCPHSISALDPAYVRHCCVNCPLRLDAVAVAEAANAGAAAAAGGSGSGSSCSSQETAWSTLLKSVLQSYGVWPLQSTEAASTSKAAGAAGRGTSTKR